MGVVDYDEYHMLEFKLCLSEIPIEIYHERIAANGIIRGISLQQLKQLFS